jgi:hypothetical protein
MKAQLDWEAEARKALKTPYSVEEDRQKKQRERNQRVSELIRQGSEFYRERKFDQARVLAEQAYDLDPDNPAAVSFRLQVTLATNKQKFDQGEKQKEEIFIDHLNMNYKNVVDSNKPLSMDRDIWNKSKDRDKSPHTNGYRIDLRTDIEKQIDHKLNHHPISVKFKNTPLKQAIQDLKYLSGLNVVPNTKMLEEDAGDAGRGEHPAQVGAQADAGATEADLRYPRQRVAGHDRKRFQGQDAGRHTPGRRPGHRADQPGGAAHDHRWTISSSA